MQHRSISIFKSLAGYIYNLANTNHKLSVKEVEGFNQLLGDMGREITNLLTYAETIEADNIQMHSNYIKLFEENQKLHALLDLVDHELTYKGWHQEIIKLADIYLLKQLINNRKEKNNAITIETLHADIIHVNWLKELRYYVRAGDQYEINSNFDKECS